MRDYCIRNRTGLLCIRNRLCCLRSIRWKCFSSLQCKTKFCCSHGTHCLAKHTIGGTRFNHRNTLPSSLRPVSLGNCPFLHLFLAKVWFRNKSPYHLLRMHSAVTLQTDIFCEKKQIQLVISEDTRNIPHFLNR